MNTDALKALFEVNHYAIGANARDLTHEESLLEPHPGANSANWVLGHIVHNRRYILEMVGEQPVWSEQDGEPYKRGSQPIDRQSAKNYPDLLQALDLSQERLMAGLGRLPDEKLGKVSDKESLGRKLAFLQFHEAYHAGQLGILRRVAGKPGAIR
jgi:uncharacterized damage-inducible protein DinB